MIEDFDIFTNEINLTKPCFKNMVKKFVSNCPWTPNTSNYESARKLLAEDCFADNDDVQSTFHFSEAVSASIRTNKLYREEQREVAGDKLKESLLYLRPEQDIIKSNPISKEDKKLLDLLIGTDDVTTVTESLKDCQIEREEPFHQRYLKFSTENNVDNFHKILKEFPKEWTIVQLTAAYDPSDNFKPLSEHQTQVDSIYLSLFTNDYLEECGLPPFTLNMPANAVKEGIKPLFVELCSILEQNYRTLERAQFLNTKKLIKNYWDTREEIDLRMKSVINVMDKQWLGGWGALLTGRLLDQGLRQSVGRVVDAAIADWGFIRLTKKQKVLLYNLLEGCSNMTSQQIKSCIRKILTENGDIDDLRQVLNPCSSCSKDFKLANELCLTCLSSCFEKLHHFSLTDGIRAFSQVATLIKDGDEFSALKKAERHPVILIVDEVLDTFPWEVLPVLNHHPVSRVENVHFLYYLYKQHECDIVDGYFLTRGREGRYVINPEKNLDRMEKRMSTFVKYWCADWTGHIGVAPSPQDFLSYLTDSDIFLYCGHGDGCQFAQETGSAGVESAERARAVCVLAGCGSARLLRAARGPPLAAPRRLHVAGCPSVVGMLWEVTDLEVDKVVSSLLAACVPTAAGAPWRDVGKEKWSQGVIDTQVEHKGVASREPDLLRGVVLARASSHFVMIAASVVARGLPVKIR